jgi:1-acyl-sn-glycerol-3-phosphate acyltransferase
MGSFLHDVRDAARGWRWSRRPLPPAAAEPFVRPRDRRDFPTQWARTRPARGAREAILRAGFKPLVWSQVAPRVSGLDRLDGVRGPVLFASNHTSHLDAPLILCSLPERFRRRVAVAAASDYFFDSWWRATGTALAFNTFPVDRGAGELSALPGDLLADGWSLLIFPEGSRSPDGWARRFKHGTAWLALDNGVPTVPIAIRGAHAAMPRGRGWPRPGRDPVSVRFGAPAIPRADETSGSYTERLEGAVARLLDEDGSDWWAAMRRAADGHTPPASGPDVAPWRRRWESSRPLPRARTHRARTWGRR